MAASQEDAELIQLYLSTRSPAVREEIVERYASLVHFVLGRLGVFRSNGMEYEDAASQGLIGLIEAVDRYDPAHGTQFSTYASLKIRSRVLDHLRSLDWLSRSARKRARGAEKAARSFCDLHQRMPTDDELAGLMGVSAAEAQQAMLDASRVLVSLDALDEASQEGEDSLHETLADENQVDPEQACGDTDLREQLESHFRSLPERDQILLSLYYVEELTFKEIGQVLSISESRACQLHARSILTLRTLMASEHEDLDEIPVSMQERIAR